MLDMNQIRKGKIILFESEPFVVVSAQFLRKQQRRPVMKTILKHVRTGKTKEHSYQQSDKIEEANIESRSAQYLYATGDKFTFMDMTTYEQMDLDASIVGEAAPYLLEGTDAGIVYFEGKPMSVELPIKIDRKIIEAPPGVKGDTSANVTKEAKIEGGLTIRVPLFINEGDLVKIDTRTGEYLERA